MKKVLIATTALVGTAGMAAAEISFSGNARFGLTYQEADRTDDAGREQEVVLEQRLRFQVQGTATSDNGLEFEARFRAEAGEDVDNSISGGGFGAAGFAVSTGGLRLDVGHVSDVTDSGDTFGYYGAAEVGFTAFLGQYSNASGAALGSIGGFGSGDASQTTIKLRYNVGDFTVAASYSNNEQSAVDETGLIGLGNDIDEFQIGVGYSFGNYRVGLNYIDVDGDIETTDATTGEVTARVGVEDDAIVLGLSGEIGAASFSVLIADADEQDDTLFGASLNYDIGAATAIQVAFSDGGASGNDTAFGVGFSHSLGGGVTLGGGGQNTSGDTVADLGVSFGF